MRSKLYISCSFILFHFVIFDPFPSFFPGPERGPEGGPERGSRKGVQKGGVHVLSTPHQEIVKEKVQICMYVTLYPMS